VPHGGGVTMEVGSVTVLQLPSTEGTLEKVVKRMHPHRPACRGGLLPERRASRGPWESLCTHGMSVHGFC